MRRPVFLVILTLLGALAAGPALAQPPPTPGPGGSEHYHLKWMTPDGRIEWLDTDARTGRVLGAAPGRDSFDGPGPGRFFAPAPSYPIPEPGFGRRDFSPGGPEGGPWRGGGRGGYGGGRGFGGGRGRDR